MASPSCRRGAAAEVLQLVQAVIGREAKRVTEIKGGAPFKAEIDETLRKHGVIE